MAINDIEGGRNEPRKVKLRSRKHSFGFKVRGQVTEGGPRWLIDGKEYRNLQTVSEVYPESAADDGGVQPGDKILSMYVKAAFDVGIRGDMTCSSLRESDKIICPYVGSKFFANYFIASIVLL